MVSAGVCLMLYGIVVVCDVLCGGVWFVLCLCVPLLCGCVLCVICCVMVYGLSFPLCASVCVCVC